MREAGEAWPGALALTETETGEAVVWWLHLVVEVQVGWRGGKERRRSS